MVIGVESGKFRAERVTENICQAALRLRLEHPIVNDRQFRIWRSYAVNAWPTIVIVDAEGYVVGFQPGEIMFEQLDPFIASIVHAADARGQLNRSPLPFLKPERLAAAHSSQHLSFPGKVFVGSGDRLFVADSGHDRIVALDLDSKGRTGRLAMIIGGGEPGFLDGDLKTALFDQPQGMDLTNGILYVADSGNHAVRAVDLAAGRVTTIAGTGEQARRLESGPAARTPLSSPWDLVWHHGDLYVAMAGTHQIAVVTHAGDPAIAEVRPYAGSGAEDLHDGPLRSAALAQPMGIVSDGQRLYFADSESSAVRWADMSPDQRVGTLAGRGLFDFGDVDGGPMNALLQHAQGVAFHEGLVYAADTYNHKVKVIDPATRRVSTLLGDGEPGDTDGASPRFYEPSGLAVLGQSIYIADTNNHVIRVADLTNRTVQTLQVAPLPPY